MDRGRTSGWCAAGVIAAAGAYVPAQSPSTGRAAEMSAAAERYVKLVLAVGQHDADYVDAYYGPPEWRKEVQAAKAGLPEIAARAAALRGDLAKAPATPPSKN